MSTVVACPDCGSTELVNEPTLPFLVCIMCSEIVDPATDRAGAIRRFVRQSRWSRARRQAHKKGNRS